MRFLLTKGQHSKYNVGIFTNLFILNQAQSNNYVAPNEDWTHGTRDLVVETILLIITFC